MSSSTASALPNAPSVLRQRHTLSQVEEQPGAVNSSPADTAPALDVLTTTSSPNANAVPSSTDATAATTARPAPAAPRLPSRRTVQQDHLVNPTPVQRESSFDGLLRIAVPCGVLTALGVSALSRDARTGTFAILLGAVAGAVAWCVNELGVRSRLIVQNAAYNSLLEAVTNAGGESLEQLQIRLRTLETATPDELIYQGAALRSLYQEEFCLIVDRFTVFYDAVAHFLHSPQLLMLTDAQMALGDVDHIRSLLPPDALGLAASDMCAAGRVISDALAALVGDWAAWRHALADAEKSTLMSVESGDTSEDSRQIAAASRRTQLTDRCDALLARERIHEGVAQALEHLKEGAEVITYISKMRIEERRLKDKPDQRLAALERQTTEVEQIMQQPFGPLACLAWQRYTAKVAREIGELHRGSRIAARRAVLSHSSVSDLGTGDEGQVSRVDDVGSDHNSASRTHRDELAARALTAKVREQMRIAPFASLSMNDLAQEDFPWKADSSLALPIIAKVNRLLADKNGFSADSLFKHLKKMRFQR